MKKIIIIIGILISFFPVKSYSYNNIFEIFPEKIQNMIQKTLELFEKFYYKTELNISPKFSGESLNIPSFMFHYIEDTPKDSHDKLRYNLSFSPKKFEELMMYLDKNDIETLTFWDIKNILEGKRKIPEKAIILGFDDGHLDHYTEAYKILKKYNRKGVFYIIANKPGNDQNFMNWEQIKEMQENGQEIGGHSFSHPNLAFTKNSELNKEIIESKKIIEKQIGFPIISFAYPLGKYNNFVKEIVEKTYLFARTTKNGSKIDIKKLSLIPTIRITPEYNISNISKFFQ